MGELPLARVAHLLTIFNTGKSGAKSNFSDFLFFAEKSDEDVFPANAALAAISLHAEKKLPVIFLNAMKTIREAAKQATETPKVRAYVSRCGHACILAPTQVDGKIKGIISVDNGMCGIIQFHDIDKKNVTFMAELKPKPDFAYISEGWLKIVSS
jgi:hypothetical protein